MSVDEMSSACDEGDFEKVRQLVAEGFNVQQPFHGIYRAAESDTEEHNRIVKFLVQNGAKPTAYIFQGPACSGNLDLITFLVESGFDPTGANGDDAPIVAACSMGHMDVVRFLEEHGCNPLNPEYEDGAETGFLGAIMGGHLDMVKYLLQKGVTQVDDWAIDIAREKGHTAVVEYLEHRSA